MKSKIIGIYKITNPKGLVYIGQSVDIANRKWKYMSACCKNQTKIYRSLLKYGWINHTFQVIHECNEYELNDLECYYIGLYNSISNGLNLKEGGRNGRLTDEHKKKISKSLIGKVHSRESYDRANDKKRGRKMPEYQRLHLSAISVNNPNFLYANRQIVYNIENGVFYESAKEAAYLNGYNYNTLKGRLNGSKVNNTNLRYA